MGSAVMARTAYKPASKPLQKMDERKDWVHQLSAIPSDAVASDPSLSVHQLDAIDTKAARRRLPLGTKARPRGEATR